MNEYGIVLGGPVIKNKLFLFGNYDGYRYAKGVVPPCRLIPRWRRGPAISAPWE